MNKLVLVLFLVFLLGSVFAADRYWVGGDGSWSTSNTANWAACSGCAGGESIPTSEDNVYFDENSGSGGVSIVGTTNATNNLTINNTGILFSASTVMYADDGCYVNFIAAKARGPRVYGDLNDVDGKLSTVTLAGSDGTKTINSNTSLFHTIIFDGNAEFKLESNITTQFLMVLDDLATFNGNDKNVIITREIHSKNNFQFHNLVFEPDTKRRRIDVVGDLNIGNQFIINGASNIERVLVSSSFYDTTKDNVRYTINSNENVFSYVAFESIIAGGSADWDLQGITGEASDYGNNTGITFAPGMNLYYVGGSEDGDWSDASKWMTTSGGSTTGRVPLAQDKAFIDGSSFVGSRTLTANTMFLSDINFSGSVDVEFFIGEHPLTHFYLKNNFDLRDLDVLSGANNSSLYLFSSENSYINPLQGYMNNYFYLMSDYNYVLLNDWNATGLWVYKGGFNSNENVLSGGTFSASPSSRLFDITNSNVNFYLRFSPSMLTNFVSVNSTLIATPVYSSELNLGCYDSNVVFNDYENKVDRVLPPSNPEDSSGKPIVRIYGSNTFNTITLDANTLNRFSGNTLQTVNNFNAVGVVDGLIDIHGFIGQGYLVKAGGGVFEGDYLDITDMNVSPADTWYAGDNSIDGGNNDGWLFEAYVPPDSDPPTTSISGCGVGWNNTNQTITLDCNDGAGSGCDSTTYRLNGGAWNDYTIPFTLSTDLNHQIDFNSTDVAGNVEATNTSYCAVFTDYKTSIPVRPEALVAGYSFFRHAGDFVGTNDGTVYGATLTTNRFGETDKAYDFNGTGNYIENTPIDISKKDFTVNFWVKSPSGSSYSPSSIQQNVIGFRPTEVVRGIGFDKTTDNTITFKMRSNSGLVEINSQVLQITNWYNFIGTYNYSTNNMCYYQNGILLECKTGINDINTITQTRLIGGSTISANSEGLVGSVDDILIYNEALTEDEISALYQYGRLVGGYGFDGDANDVSFNQNHGTVYGATLTENRFGDTNKAMSFDGDDDSISLNASGSNNYSYALWVKSESGVGVNAFLGNTNSTNYNNRILLYRDNNIQVKLLANGGTATKILNVTHSFGNWDFYVINVLDETVELYINGEYKGITATGAGGDFGDGNYFYIGKNGIRNKDFFNGSIDDVIILDYALSEDEVEELYLRGNYLGTGDWILPTTTLTQTSGLINQWNNTNIGFTLACADEGGAGCKTTQYRLNSGIWNTYSSEVTLTTDLNHLIEYRSIDNNDNNESIKTYYIAIDKTIPTYTSLTNANTWRNVDSNFIINSVDYDLSGKQFARYNLNSTGWQDLNTSGANEYFTFTHDGNLPVQIFIRDNAGNDLNINTFAAKDVNATQVDIYEHNSWHTEDFNLIFIPSYSVSGKLLSQYQIDGNGWVDFGEDYNSIQFTTDGNYRVDYNFVNNAGWINTGTVYGLLDKTNPILHSFSPANNSEGYSTIISFDFNELQTTNYGIVNINGGASDFNYLSDCNNTIDELFTCSWSETNLITNHNNIIDFNIYNDLGQSSTQTIIYNLLTQGGGGGGGVTPPSEDRNFMIVSPVGEKITINYQLNKATPQRFVLQNTGNVDLIVSVQTTNTLTEFYGIRTDWDGKLKAGETREVIINFLVLQDMGFNDFELIFSNNDVIHKKSISLVQSSGIKNNFSSLIEYLNFDLGGGILLWYLLIGLLAIIALFSSMFSSGDTRVLLVSLSSGGILVILFLIL
jgi:hypothetical protein